MQILNLNKSNVKVKITPAKPQVQANLNTTAINLKLVNSINDTKFET